LVTPKSKISNLKNRLTRNQEFNAIREIKGALGETEKKRMVSKSPDLAQKRNNRVDQLSMEVDKSSYKKKDPLSQQSINYVNVSQEQNLDIK